MDTLLLLMFMGSLIAGAYFLIRIIIAAIRSQPKGVYAKKLLTAIAVFFIAGFGHEFVREPSEPPANSSKPETQLAEEKTVAEQTAEPIAEVKPESSKPQPPPETKKNNADEEFEKKFAKLSDANKEFYQKTYEELSKREGLLSDHAYTEQEARAEALERALYKQSQDDKKAGDAAKEQEKISARAKEDLAKFEQDNSVSYQDLGDGTFNVTITFKHGSMYMRIDDKNEYYNPEDKEKMYLAREGAQIVQMFNEAGVKVNHFTINFTGAVINENGDKWNDTIAICEFDNKKFAHNDFKGFYNGCSRFWIMPSNFSDR